MRRPLAAAALAASLTACGGEPEIGLGLQLLRAEGLEAVKAVHVAFHPPSRTCGAIQRSPAARGLYQVDLDATSGTGQQEINEIRAGRYVVAAFGRATADAEPIAFGCAADQAIEDGKQATITIELRPL